jgi:hypothetical protein
VLVLLLLLLVLLLLLHVLHLLHLRFFFCKQSTITTDRKTKRQRQRAPTLQKQNKSEHRGGGGD